MADLSFTTGLKWQGTGRTGEGMVKLAEAQVSYSAPAVMGGKGAGTSPEELLIAAVSTCYSGTLFAVLRKDGLPVDEVLIQAEGTVSGYPMQAKFARLCVHPTIRGGDPTQVVEYQRAAETARDKCFIGKTIVGNVAYDVGDVKIIADMR